MKVPTEKGSGWKAELYFSNRAAWFSCLSRALRAERESPRGRRLLAAGWIAQTHTIRPEPAILWAAPGQNQNRQLKSVKMDVAWRQAGLPHPEQLDIFDALEA